MRATTVLAVSILGACGGSHGLVTGWPVDEAAPPTGSPVVEVSEAGVSTSVASAAPTTATEFDHLMELRIACGRRPEACDVDAFALVGSPFHEEQRRLMSDRAMHHIVASRDGAIRYRIDQVAPGDPGTVITTCLFDDVVLTMDGAVFDDSTFSAVIAWTMVPSPNGARLSDSRVVSSSTEVDLCAASA